MDSEDMHPDPKKPDTDQKLDSEESDDSEEYGEYPEYDVTYEMEELDLTDTEYGAEKEDKEKCDDGEDKNKEEAKKKGVVDCLNAYLESIFSTYEEYDEEIEKQLIEMYLLLWRILSGTVGMIGIIILIVKYPQYLHTLHENQLWFSNIKEVEREISFRTEQGLYYSYYKQILKAPDWADGVSMLTEDNATEHGRTINIFHRFNVMPEVVVSLLYKHFTPQDPPIIFYVATVFRLHGMYIATLFVTSWYLSSSCLGGFITSILFIVHRVDTTRVNYTIPLRESFAIPLLFMQIFVICTHLKSPKFRKLKVIGIMWLTFLFLMSWQFAPFVLFCQVFTYVTLSRLRIISINKVLGLVLNVLISLLATCILQWHPPLVISSPVLSMLPPAIIMCSSPPAKRTLSPLVRLSVAAAELALLLIATAVSNGAIKFFLNIDADSHVYQLFLAKLQMGDQRDFDSRLYMCNEAFMYLDLETAKRLSQSGLLPVYVAGIVIFGWSLASIFCLKYVERCPLCPRSAYADKYLLNNMEKKDLNRPKITKDNHYDRVQHGYSGTSKAKMEETANESEKIDEEVDVPTSKTSLLQKNDNETVEKKADASSNKTSLLQKNVNENETVDKKADVPTSKTSLLQKNDNETVEKKADAPANKTSLLQKNVNENETIDKKADVPTSKTLLLQKNDNETVEKKADAPTNKTSLLQKNVNKNETVDKKADVPTSKTSLLQKNVCENETVDKRADVTTKKTSFLQNFFKKAEVCNSNTSSIFPVRPFMANRPDLIFVIVLSLLWSFLALMIMRLKVLWLPTVCILSGVFINDCRFYKYLFSKHDKFWSFFPRWFPGLCKVALSLSFAAYLFRKYWGQISSDMWPEEMYEFWDPDTVELMEWIQQNTPSEAVFAGSMQLMAGVKLCTGRRITNHPHYEDSWLRQRTHDIYQIYGRESPKAVHEALQNVGATHIILEDSICLTPEDPKHPLCRLTDIIDLHNGHIPVNGSQGITGLKPAGYERFCDAIRRAEGDYKQLFSLVMSNKTFRVYRIAAVT